MGIAFVLARAATYATLFVGLVLVVVPARLIAQAGIPLGRPPAFGVASGLGIAIGVIGAFVAVWCILTFAFVGRGTPAPFDPPRRLVARGPYAFVRNPMYLGAGLALLGAALYYASASLAAYAAVFLLAMHAFVLGYEEPTLRATFGPEYEAYCRVVGRWRPRLGGRSSRDPHSV